MIHRRTLVLTATITTGLTAAPSGADWPQRRGPHRDAVSAETEAYREHGSFDIPDARHPSWSHPVISGGHVFLREQDNLYRHNVRRK